MQLLDAARDAPVAPPGAPPFRPRPLPRPSLAWLVPWRGPGTYVAWGAALSTVYVLTTQYLRGAPWEVPAAVPCLVSASTVVAIVVGVVRFRPAPAWPWLLLAVGRAGYTVADTLSYSRAFSGHPLPFPSVADALYLAHYATLIGCVLGLIRARGGRHDRAALVDATIVAATCGATLWLFVLSPGDAATVPARAVGLAYLVMDTAALSVGIRLLTGAGARTASMRLLTLSVALLLGSDIAYNVLLLHGAYQPGGAVDVAWFAVYVTLGAAALHPSMAHRADVRAEDTSYAPLGRLVVLGAAALIGPVSSLLTDGFEPEGLASILALLVVVRLGGLLRVQAAAERERAALVAEVLAAAERERTRIAAELHDGPIQRLAGLGLMLDRADLALERAGSPARRDVAAASTGVHNEIVDLRRVMAELRPPALDQGGLAGALADYVRSLGDGTGPAVTLQVDLGEAAIDPDVETVLYRVAQEALSNARRHAFARRIDVRLRSEPDAVHLTVADDGVGFDAARVRIALDHFGVASMRERTQHVGGTCRVVTGPGGTTVHAAVPHRRRRRQ